MNAPPKQQFIQKDMNIQDQVPIIAVSKQSEYLAQYEAFFRNLKDQPLSRNIIIQKLAHHSIKYQPQSPHQTHPLISIFKKSNNSEIVVLVMRWGKFQQKLTTINFSHPNPHLPKKIRYKQQRQSVLYSRSFNGKQIMFKSQHLKQNRSHTILNVLRQIFIAKIASALQFGPSCSVDTCFDLFLYDNCIEMGMEKCLKFRKRSFQKLNLDSLRSGLRLMHSLQIIHYDIKPDNIMLSKSLNKLVAIDFNLSDIVDFQLGKKIPMPFRGTINFCCPDMVHNFVLAQSPRLIDPYYNDVYCLKKSLQFNDDQFIEEDIAQIQYQQQYLEEQCEYVLLKLKSLLFAEQWQKAENVYRQCREAFEDKEIKKITQFLYELDISEKLEHFYHTYIPKHCRDTLFMREFNHLLSKKWMINVSTVSVTSEKRKEFQSRMLHLIKGQKCHQYIFSTDVDKKYIREFLENEQMFKCEQSIYFSIFLDFISYDRNLYKVNKEERILMAKICNKFIIMLSMPLAQQIAEMHCIYQINEKQKNFNQIQKALIYILWWSISSISKQQDKQKDHQKNIMLRNALWKILPFIFILDIGTVEQNLCWFDYILNSMTTIEDKIAISLSIKHLNEWNRYRIGRKKNHNRFQAYSIILEKIVLTLNDIQRQADSSLLKIINFALGQSTNNTSDPNEFREKSSHRLEDALKCQNILRFLQISFNDINTIQTVYETLRRNGDIPPQFQHLYIPFYDRCRLYGWVQIYFEFYKVFSQNFNDSSLQKQFSIYYNNLSLGVLTRQKVESRIECLQEYLNKIDGDLSFNQELIEEFCAVQQFVDDLAVKIPKESSFRLQKRVRGISRKISELQMRNQKQSRNFLSVHAFYSTYSSIAVYYTNLKRYNKFEDYCDLLDKLGEGDYHNNSRWSKDEYLLFRIMCLQNWILVFMPNNTLQLFNRLHQQFTVIVQRIQGQNARQDQLTFSIIIFHILLNFGVFCTFSKQYEARYKGLRNLYRFVKYEKTNLNNSYAWIYFGQKKMCQMLLTASMEILYEKQPQQFLYLLQLFSEFLEKNLTQRNFNTVLFGFTKIVTSLSKEDQLSLFQIIKAESRKGSNTQNIFIIYFYVLAQYIQQPLLQQKIFYLIACSLHSLPFDFLNYYSSQIHRHFVAKLRKEGKQFTRRENYLNNKLVKLFILMRRSYSKREKKYSKLSDNRLKLRLRQKLRRVQGPFRLSQLQVDKFQFQYKIKPKK